MSKTTRCRITFVGVQVNVEAQIHQQWPSHVFTWRIRWFFHQHLIAYSLSNCHLFFAFVLFVLPFLKTFLPTWPVVQAAACSCNSVGEKFTKPSGSTDDRMVLIFILQRPPTIYGIIHVYLMFMPKYIRYIYGIMFNYWILIPQKIENS